ncbi:MAG: ABC transporter ATP-binding protein [Elusimicrobia bacterium]|nr:ABC transporter ATP-binding protein [Elusimicrobiota bacterium]
MLERAFRKLHAETSPNGLRVTAIKDLSLTFHRGEFSAIAGPSGSGKSTLLNLIGTLDPPTHGKIFFQDKEVTYMSEDALADFRLRSIGFIFQAYNLLPVLTAAENVAYVLDLQGAKVPGFFWHKKCLAHFAARKERRARALEALEMVGLKSQADRFPRQLSGGQQQRVAIARAIVHRPTVVLADEITANLDSKTSESLLDLMQDLNKKKGVTFIFSSHDPLVLSRAKRVIQLRDGMLT